MYGNKYEIPSDVLSKLEKYSSETTIANLLKNGSITYSNMKKILHDMNNGEIDKLGGQDFKQWVETTLSNSRESLSNTQDIKKDTGMFNSHIKPHEKKNSIVRPSQVHGNTLSKHNVAVIESLQRINEIMKKII